MQLQTRNNTYTLDFSKVTKTTYEERREKLKGFRTMLIQKALGISLMGLSLLLIINGAGAAIVSLLFGLCVILTNENVISINYNDDDYIEYEDD